MTGAAHQLEEELAAVRAELAAWQATDARPKCFNCGAPCASCAELAKMTTWARAEVEHIAIAIAAASLQWHPTNAQSRWLHLSEWGRERYRDDARSLLKALASDAAS